MENRKMTFGAKFLQILNFLFLLFLGIFIISRVNFFERINFQGEFKEKFEKEFGQEFKKIFKEPITKEVKEETKEVEKEGLKFQLKVHFKKLFPISFPFKIIVKENKIFLAEDFERTFALFKKIFPFESSKEITKQELEELKKLKEAFEKEKVFKKFETTKDGVEFEIDTEKLKEILKKEKEIDQLGSISGKIFLDQDKLMKKIEIETYDFKVEIFPENLKEKIKTKGQKDDFENFLISILGHPF